MVVGVAHAMPDLLELVKSDLSRLIDSLYDVTGHVVGELALLAAPPKLAPVRIVLAELSWTRNPLALHVFRSMLPHAVEARAVRISGCFREVHPHAELSTRDEPRSTWPFGIVFERLWPSLTFRHFLTSDFDRLIRHVQFAIQDRDSFAHNDEHISKEIAISLNLAQSENKF